MRAAFGHEDFELGGGLLHLGLDRDELGELFGGDPSSGLPGQVPGSDGGEHAFGLSGGDVLLRLPGKEFRKQGLEPVDGLYPTPGEGFAAFDEHPEHLELRVDGQDPQVLGPDRGDRDRVRVVGVGLAAVPGVEQPGSGGELGRDVDDVLAGLEEALRERPADTTGAFDGPHPLGQVLA